MAEQIQIRRDTIANWTSVDPILAQGEIGIETDDLLTTPKFKIGNGIDIWSVLPYGTGGITSVGYSDLDGELVYPAYNGWIGMSVSTVSALATSGGGVVTLTVEKSGGGDIIALFSGGFVTVDCTPALTIALTQGTDAAPQINYVYILKSAPTVLTKSTTGFPTTEEYLPIGEFLVETAATVATYGLYKDLLYSNDVWRATENGHIAQISAWIRQQPASWVDGCLCTPTLSAGPTPDTLTIAIASGNVYQLHLHSTPAFDSSGGGTTNLTTFFSPNHPTAYTSGKDLCTSTFLQLANGTTPSGTNKRISWVVWGAVDDTNGNFKIFVNLPTGYYTSDANAIADDSRYATYSIPATYNGVGFLIARLTYQITNSTPGSYALTLVENLDLRGTYPSRFAGGSATGLTIFPDSVFRVDNVTDSTKKLAFDVSSVTTATTRTLVVPDANGTIALLEGGNYTGAINEAKGADIASAGTTNIGAGTGNYIVITGTTTITAFDTIQAGTRRILKFSGALTLTHNGTSLILPGGANITTANGDTCIMVSLGSGNWICVAYTKANGVGVVTEMEIMTGSLAVFSPSDSTTTYIGMSTPLAPSATNTVRQFQLPNGTIEGAMIYVDPTSTLGSNDTVTYELYNITDAAVVGTLGTITYDVRGNQSQFNVNLAVLSTKFYSVRITNPAFGTNPTNCYTLCKLKWRQS